MALNLNGPLSDDPRVLLTEYRKTRAVRLAMDKEVEAVAKREAALKDRIIALVDKDGDGIVADGYACRVTTKAKPTIENAALLREHILATGELDLFQQRLSDKAVKDRWDAGVVLPGVGRFNAVDLSVVKL